MEERYAHPFLSGAALAATILTPLHAAVLLSPRPTEAATCLPRTAMAEGLGAKFGEVVIAAAPDSSGSLIEVYSAQGGTTWTIVVTTPAGISCIVSAGEGWRWRDDVEWPSDGPRADALPLAPTLASTTVIVKCPDAEPPKRPRACPGGPLYPCPNPGRRR